MSSVSLLMNVRVLVLFHQGNNPQYCLRVNSSEPSATVWVLLSRHITAKVGYS